MKTVNLNRFKVEQKMRDFKEGTKRQIYKAGYWIQDNRDWLVIVVPAATTAVSIISKSYSRNKAIKAEQRLKENFLYDRSIGNYIEIKRKLKPREHIEIDARRRAGESLVSILNDMKLIKK